MTTKHILLAICGGIAAYKAAELVRLLRKDGAEVRVVLTAAAAQFVTPLTLQALSGQPVHTALLDAGQEQAMGHIHLARWADLLLVAPATADMLGKFAGGLADDLLSTLYLAAECPVLAAPAMNQAMWRKAATQRNVARLLADGVLLLGPEAGEQACGETGPGRMSEPAAIAARARQLLQPGGLAGVRMVITAGPTREPLDPVRFISNRSSGRMGYALAQAAAAAGAAVTLVSGPCALATPYGVTRVDVETALQMHEAVMAAVAGADIFIGAAAVADYRPAAVADSKLKKTAGTAGGSIELVQNPDIIAAVAGREDRPFTVGFAAETSDVAAYALDKLQRKQLDMIAANRVGGAEGGFDSERNALDVFWPGGSRQLAMTAKTELARQLLELVAEQFRLSGRPRA